MRILALSPLMPHREVLHAGGQFLYRHLEALAEGHEVTLAVPGTTEAEHHRNGAPSGVAVVTTPFDQTGLTSPRIQLDRARRRTRFRALGAPALRGLRASGLAVMAQEADVVELHWTDCAILVRELRRAGVTSPLVVVAYDVTGASIPARIARTGTPLQRAAAHLWNPLRRRTEAADLRAADLVLVFSDADAAALRDLGVQTPAHVLEPWVDVPAVSAGPPADGPVLFTGAMWRPENQDGVAWFLRAVWPSVRAARPTAELVVAGADPPEWLRGLATEAGGVTVTGTVPDLEPLYGTAAAFVAPLFVPGGLKFKVPQAMAHGLPVIATPVAAEGIAGVAPEGALWAVTGDAQQMAQAVVDVLDQPDAARATGAAARAWVAGRYSFPRAAQALLDRYRALQRRA